MHIAPASVAVVCRALRCYMRQLEHAIALAVEAEDEAAREAFLKSHREASNTLAEIEVA